jgi:hypothetical protein
LADDGVGLLAEQFGASPIAINDPPPLIDHVNRRQCRVKQLRQPDGGGTFGHFNQSLR